MLSERPWLKFYGDIPHSINYPQVTMYEALMSTVERYPDALAYDFLGYTSTYRHLGEEIDLCAEHLIKWSCPREIEFRPDLPKTLVGKVAFSFLEQEEIDKLKAEGKYAG